MAVPTLFGSAVFASTAAGQALTGNQIYSHVTALANGHFALAWNGDNSQEVAFFKANGVEAGAGTAFYSVTNGTLAALNSQIGLAALSDGRMVAAWSNNTVTAADSGEIQWAYFTETEGMGTVNTIVRSGYQGELSVAASVNGRFVLVGKYDGAGDLDAGRLSAFNGLGVTNTGGFFGSAGSIGPGTGGVQEQPAVVTLADGRYVMVAIDRTDNSIGGTIMDSTGSRTLYSSLTPAGEAPDDPIEQRDTIALTALANGGLAMAWKVGSALHYRLYDSNLAPTTAVLSSTSISAIYEPALVALQDGRMMLISTKSGFGIFGQLIKADGTLDGTAFQISADGYVPSAAVLADGRVAVSYTVGGTGFDVKYQIVDPRESGLYGVSASDGADEWYGTAFADFTLMGSGNDTFNAGAGVDFIYGEDGNDTLNGGDAGDTLIGGNGNDILNGDANDDALHGDVGNDTLNGGTGDDFLYGGAGADTLIGGTGFDYASYLLATAGVTADLAGTNAGTGDALGDTFTTVDGLIGSNFADALFGDANANWIYGGDGNDNLFGRGGADVLIAGNGDDSLDGGAGADALYGEAGFNTASYGSAAVGVTADLGNVALNTGDAAGDTYSNIQAVSGSIFADVLRGDGNANTLSGNDGNDSLFGRGGADTLVGGAGDDVLAGGAGGDAIIGGAGFDYASYSDATAGVTADLQFIANNLGDALGDSYASVEGLIGSAFADSLRGDTQDNWIYGGDGADFIYGRDGADTLLGEAGDDALYGNVGNDRLYGGAGNDTFVFAVGDGKDVFADFVGGAGASDTVLLSTALGVSNFAQLLTKAAQVGSDVVITFDVNTTITLAGVSLGALSSDDFGFF